MAKRKFQGDEGAHHCFKRGGKCLSLLDTCWSLPSFDSVAQITIKVDPLKVEKIIGDETWKQFKSKRKLGGSICSLTYEHPSPTIFSLFSTTWQLPSAKYWRWTLSYNNDRLWWPTLKIWCSCRDFLKDNRVETPPNFQKWCLNDSFFTVMKLTVHHILRKKH